MKALIYVFSLFVGMALLFYPTTTISLSSGSPGGKTGSPSDNSDCTSCHSVLATTSNLTAITSNIPSSGYVPGITYTITASLNPNSPKNGFEVTCEEDATGTKTGTFFITNTNTTKLVNSGSSVTHKASGNTLNTWSFEWEAPTQGTGSVTFYGAFIEAGYPWSSNIGDYFSSYSLSVQEYVPMPQTYVPDDSFELFLESNGMGNGILFDDSVLTANINTVTHLSLSGLGIFDLTGIEEFDSLTFLDCQNNQLTTLDMSNNMILQTLILASNQLTNLNISQNTTLISLGCSGNLLSTLDLSQNTNLNHLDCQSNQITTLDVSQNFDLMYLNCANNNLNTLSVTQNPLLNDMICNDNQLTTLDLRNGNNTFLQQMECYNNSALTCINVDDSTWASANWSFANGSIDQQHYFSSNCPPNCVNNNFNCADSLQVTDVTIIPSTSTIIIGIYNGYNSFLSYPHVTYTIDANGDTVHTGQLNSFGTFGLDTSWYSYQLSSSSSPTIPLSIYFVYTGGSFVSDTCLLTFNNFTTNIIERDPNHTKEILKITDLLGRQTQPIKNTPLIYIYKNGIKEKRIILD